MWNDSRPRQITIYRARFAKPQMNLPRRECQDRRDRKGVTGKSDIPRIDEPRISGQAQESALTLLPNFQGGRLKVEASLIRAFILVNPSTVSCSDAYRLREQIAQGTEICANQSAVSTGTSGAILGEKGGMGLSFQTRRGGHLTTVAKQFEKARKEAGLPNDLVLY